MPGLQADVPSDHQSTGVRDIFQLATRLRFNSLTFLLFDVIVSSSMPPTSITKALPTASLLLASDYSY